MGSKMKIERYKSIRETLPYITADELEDEDIIVMVSDVSENVSKNLTLGELKRFLSRKKK